MNHRLPDFIIGGAPRSGTTWLYRALDRHPEIYMAKPTPPEPKFFLVDELYAAGIEHYSRQWFSDTGGKRILGEKSTNYLESKVAAERIQKHIPDVKLIFVLRDPVERAISNYRWSKMNKMENQDLETALILEQQRERNLSERLRYSRPHAYFSRGLYADHLESYLSLFPRDNILCLRFELLTETAEAFLSQVHRFLGVEVRPSGASEFGKVNEARNEEDVPGNIREKLRTAYAEPNRRLYRILGAEFGEW